MKLNQVTTRFLLAAALLLAGFFAHGQLTVTMSGDVGIGTTSPWAKTSIFNNNNNNYNLTLEDYNATGYHNGIYQFIYEPTEGTIYGIQNYAVNSGVNSFTNGLYNYTSGSRGHTVGQYNLTYQWCPSDQLGYGLYNYTYLGSKAEGYGIYNYLYSPSGGCSIGNRWGIYNYVVPVSPAGGTIGIYSSTSGAGNYAGYFDGNVRIVGSLTVVSDESKKQGISHLDNALDLVKQLNGHTYTFKEDPNMNLPEGQQYGFLAQEVESVLPSLVNTGENPNHPKQEIPTEETPKTAKKGQKPMPSNQPDLGSETIKSVNYIAVIPILVEAIKEQQAIIEQQQQQLQALQDKVGK
jgi:Chaperone of endosialidase